VLTVLENVRCLECGTVYSKPADGGTVRENPGCPDCGYVGWVRFTGPAGSEPSRYRSAGDQQPVRRR
jgi:predicted  nucleic acid-binding Zn-ribbon protein